MLNTTARTRIGLFTVTAALGVSSLLASTTTAGAAPAPTPAYTYGKEGVGAQSVVYIPGKDVTSGSCKGWLNRRTSDGYVQALVQSWGARCAMWLELQADLQGLRGPAQQAVHRLPLERPRGRSTGLHREPDPRPDHSLLRQHRLVAAAHHGVPRPGLPGHPSSAKNASAAARRAVQHTELRAAGASHALGSRGDDRSTTRER